MTQMTRVPNQRLMLESVSCPICAVDDCAVVYPSRRTAWEVNDGEFSPSGDAPLVDPLVRCRCCGMQYVNPRVPIDVALQGYASAIDERFASQLAGRELTFRRCLRKLQSMWGKPPGRLLDIGTANGSFLKVAKDAGWEVHGCEPNHWLRNWCKQRYGISVRPGTIFDAGFQGGSFDVITLWDVLEHTGDPSAVLRECERLLAPGGLLVINYPDIGSWVARLMGRRWVFLISVHNYYFTRRTIKIILDRTGFQALAIRPHIQSLQLDYILCRAESLFGALARFARNIIRGMG